MDLFSQIEDNLEKKFEVFPVPGGEILFMKNFLSYNVAQDYFQKLNMSIHWKQEEIKYYGKIFPVPRKTAWYGYEGFDYTYSGIKCHPEPWTKELLDLKIEIEKKLPDENFNSVLLNMYRDGNDKVSWHADNEKELGINPTIASLSIGETRRFDLKHKDNPELVYKFELSPGSLIVMRGALQHNYLHQIPQQKKITQPRINLTFRTIKSNLDDLR